MELAVCGINVNNCFKVLQKEDEDIKDCFNRFKNQVKVMKNNGGESGKEMESLQQDKLFSESS